MNYEEFCTEVHHKLNLLRQIEYQITREGFKEFYIKSKGKFSLSDIK